ncbi:GDSL-type esterase/lipase family protein [Roseixanthobacter pseudopolyaromaticivorans]|uniref:GDSL-type esterase/lipase family protein n=1 Tax=Xanthobacteraceae TaxID=335928 RepID=UPI00372CABD6
MADLPISSTIYTAVTAQDMAGRTSALARAKIAPGRYFRVFCGIDSLSAGGGDPLSTYRTPLAAGLKERLGDGGPGLLWFDALNAGYYSGATGGTVSAFLVGNPAWNSGARSHSLCGLGTTFTGVSGAYAGLDPGAPWDRVRIYFELGTGGSFGAVADGAGAIGETVDTTRFPTGTLCSVDLYRAATHETAMAIYSGAGTFTLFGAEFLLDGGGATVSNAGISATALAQHASLDDSWGRAWAQLLKADVYILNAGMNDRLTDDGAKYGFGINKLVGRWQAGGTDVLLVRPNDSSDVATTFLAGYDKALQMTAMARRCGYVDDRDALGVYADAVAAGFMSDLIHPNDPGNAARAAAYLAAITP